MAVLKDQYSIGFSPSSSCQPPPDVSAGSGEIRSWVLENHGLAFPPQTDRIFSFVGAWFVVIALKTHNKGSLTRA